MDNKKIIWIIIAVILVICLCILGCIGTFFGIFAVTYSTSSDTVDQTAVKFCNMWRNGEQIDVELDYLNANENQIESSLDQAFFAVEDCDYFKVEDSLTVNISKIPSISYEANSRLTVNYNLPENNPENVSVVTFEFIILEGGVWGLSFVDVN